MLAERCNGTMAMHDKNKTPRYATCPGTILKYELEERGISQKQFAEMIGIQRSHLSEFLSGKRAFNKAFADKVEESLGISSVTLLNLQTQYEYDCRQIEIRGVEEQLASAKLREYNDLLDINLLFKRLQETLHSQSEKLSYLNDMIGLPEPAAFKLEVAGMFRKSGKTGQNPRMLMTWKLLAEYTSRQQVIKNKFDINCQEALLKEISSALHLNQDTEQNVKNILERYGIAFCIVEKVEKASVDGYSFVEAGVPHIILTKRYDRIDNFAFSLLHELGHIFLHYKDNNQIERHLSIPEYDCESKQEMEANQFAANALIPDSEWEKAPKVSMNPYFIQARYSEWARQHEYNKWIVLGRISHETGMYKFQTDDSRKIH